jgi:prophage DNA circulation protein
MAIDTATIDGISLEFEHLDDTFEKAIIRHEFPFRNGALLEDMGQKARVIKLRCYFWDNGDHLTYDAHIALINHLEGTGLSEFIHPRYGIVKGCVEQVSVRHDDRIRTAEIDLTFVENFRTAIQASYVADVQAAVEEAYAAGIDEQMDEFRADMQAALGSEAISIVGIELDPAMGIVEQLQGVSLTARNWLKTVDTYVDTLEGTLDTIANPANGIVAAISFTTTLPGRVIGSAARCVERYAVLYDSLRNAPERFLESLENGYRQLEAAFEGFSKTTRIAGASHCAMTAAEMYKTDEQSRAVQKKIESARPFDAMGNYRAPAEITAPMTAVELERTLATVRGYIQDAIDVARGGDSLKAMALQMLTHVNTVKLQRESIVQIRQDNPVPLHLFCLQQGLPYQAADRLMAINTIRKPNETSGTVNCYVR